MEEAVLQSCKDSTDIGKDSFDNYSTSCVSADRSSFFSSCECLSPIAFSHLGTSSHHLS